MAAPLMGQQSKCAIKCRATYAGSGSRSLDTSANVLVKGQYVVNLLAVEVLVLERPLEAFDDAIGLRRVVTSPHVAQLGMAGDEVPTTRPR